MSSAISDGAKKRLRPIFERSGLACLSDLQTSQWEQNFGILKKWQDEFSIQEASFLSAGYPWPTRPLYSWSRVWEYPFAYHHLTRFVGGFRGTARIADVGCGVTFFPFAIADLGADVFCADIDPSFGSDLSRASAVIKHRGKINFRLISGNKLPFDEAELDAVYCISVLEHIADFENTISEISRCLKAGGLFILTFDVAVRGIEGISGERRAALSDELRRHFTRVTEPEEISLEDALLSNQGPYPMVSKDTRWFRFKQLIKPLIGHTPVSAPIIALESAVLLKK